MQQLVLQKLAQCKHELAELKHLETAWRKNFNDILYHAWKLGGILIELKEEIGHGKWLLWLGANWPELGERNAQKCMALFKQNENWQRNESAEFIGFELNSVRKFFGWYTPAKERLQLEGDSESRPEIHHLGFINEFSKWDRQLRAGHVHSFERDLFRREIEPMIRRVIDLGGADWIRSLLGDEKFVNSSKHRSEPFGGLTYTSG